MSTRRLLSFEYHSRTGLSPTSEPESEELSLSVSDILTIQRAGLWWAGGVSLREMIDRERSSRGGEFAFCSRAWTFKQAPIVALREVCMSVVQSGIGFEALHSMDSPSAVIYLLVRAKQIMTLMRRLDDLSITRGAPDSPVVTPPPVSRDSKMYVFHPISVYPRLPDFVLE